jgi:hypothetical protein
LVIFNKIFFFLNCMSQYLGTINRKVNESNCINGDMVTTQGLPNTIN